MKIKNSLLFILIALLLTSFPMVLRGSGISGSGGGGTPGGSNTQFQYNNGGTFGGAAELNWNSTTNELWGTTFNNQMVKDMAGAILSTLSACRVLVTWVSPYATEIDYSGLTHNGTYTGFVGTERAQKGFAWSLQGSAGKRIGFGDHNDFSFGNGVADSAFSVGAWIEVTDTIASQNILTKYSAVDQEWVITLNNAERINLALFDDSVPTLCFRLTDAALSLGWHHVIATYNGGGGATAANGIAIYVDGLVVASTATNDPTYVAMENLAAAMIAFDNADVNSPFVGKMGHIFLQATQLTTAQVWNLYQTTRGYYNR